MTSFSFIADCDVTQGSTTYCPRLILLDYKSILIFIYMNGFKRS